jgi:hypothetical protein
MQVVVVERDSSLTIIRSEVVDLVFIPVVINSISDYVGLVIAS